MCTGQSSRGIHIIIRKEKWNRCTSEPLPPRPAQVVWKGTSARAEGCVQGAWACVLILPHSCLLHSVTFSLRARTSLLSFITLMSVSTRRTTTVNVVTTGITYTAYSPATVHFPTGNICLYVFKCFMKPFPDRMF